MKRLLIALAAILLSVSLAACEKPVQEPVEEPVDPTSEWTTSTEATETADGMDVLLWMPSDSIEASTTYARAVAKATNSTNQTRTARLALFRLVSEQGEVIYDTGRLWFIIVGLSVPPGSTMSREVGFPVETAGRYRLQFREVLDAEGQPAELRFVVTDGNGG